MNQLLKRLWNDQGGFILSTEAMILWTITVLGMVVGLVAVRDASVCELVEVANAIMSFDQSYAYGNIVLGGAGTDTAWSACSNANDVTHLFTLSSTIAQTFPGQGIDTITVATP